MLLPLCCNQTTKTMDILIKTITSKRYELLTDEENLSRLQTKIHMFIKKHNLSTDITFYKIRMQTQRLCAKIFVHYPEFYVHTSDVTKALHDSDYISSLDELLK